MSETKLGIRAITVQDRYLKISIRWAYAGAPIRYLKAVADHGSVTRAASALHVSQPTLSQQIREFEERMGVQLLDRTGRKVRPTDAGEAYLRHVQRALASPAFC